MGDKEIILLTIVQIRAAGKKCDVRSLQTNVAIFSLD